MRPIALLAAACAAANLYCITALAQPTVAPATPEPKAAPKAAPGAGAAPAAPAAPCGNPPCVGPGAGAGPMGPGMGPGVGPGMGPGMGSGKAGQAHRGMRFGRDNTSGWSMMSRDERQAHHDRMMGLKSLDDCKAYAETHRKEMEARAKERGKPMPAMPRVDMCERMNQRGMFGKP